jgi:hypothetical protein
MSIYRNDFSLSLKLGLSANVEIVSGIENKQAIVFNVCENNLESF